MSTVLRNLGKFKKMICSFECLAGTIIVSILLGSIYFTYLIFAENPVMAIIMAAAIIVSALLFFFAIKGEPEKTIT